MFDMFYKMSMLTAECHQVIGLRMMKAVTGGDMIGQEAALMMSEKTQAAMRSGSSLLAGGSLDQLIDEYRVIVQANVLRLSQG